MTVLIKKTLNKSYDDRTEVDLHSISMQTKTGFIFLKSARDEIKTKLGSVSVYFLLQAIDYAKDTECVVALLSSIVARTRVMAIDNIICDYG